MKSEEEIRERMELHQRGINNAITSRQYEIYDIRHKELKWVLGD